MTMDNQVLNTVTTRNFGVEAEVNATDGKAGPFPKDVMPCGIYEIANLVLKASHETVQVREWGPTHWSAPQHPGLGCWVVKPDGSCGMEVCSPVSRGWYGLSRICHVIDALASSEKVTADRRCSLHVHVDISDCTPEEVANIITYWIKCEPVFMDAVPASRKYNRYCQYIGLWDWCKVDRQISPEELIRQVGKTKYMSINTWHLSQGNRATIEFRLGEAAASKSAWTVKNWVRLLLHFVERAKKMPHPGKYIAGDQWSSCLWLDPRDVFTMLGMDGGHELSGGLTQVRDWLTARLIDNNRSSLGGPYSAAARRVAVTQINEMAYELIESGVNLRDALKPMNMEEAIYGKMYRI